MEQGSGSCCLAWSRNALGGVCEPAAVYRSRHTERTPFDSIFDEQFQDYLVRGLAGEVPMGIAVTFLVIVLSCHRVIPSGVLFGGGSVR